MSALRITEEVMAAVCDAAAPIPLDHRARFLELAGVRLAALPEIGPGSAHKVLAGLQREFLVADHFANAMPGSSGK
jgi:hypothetical protein